nr:hypothetical protein [Tanacetum cinerariifolium]
EEADELYRNVNINQGRGLQVSQDIEDSHMTLTPVHPDVQQESSSVSSQFITSMLNLTNDVGMEFIFTTASSLVAPLPTLIPRMTPSIITTITIASHPPIPSTPIPSKVLQNLPTFDSVFCFDERLKSLEANFSEIKESVNAQLEAEVLTRSSHLSQTSYAVADDLSEMELKKILIEKMEGNKSIQQSDEQRNLYKALVDAYEADKTILDSYGETAILKRRREDDDDQEGPSAGSDRGSKRRIEGGELESARAPLEHATKSAGMSTTGSKSRQASASEFAFAEEPLQTTSQVEEPSHLVFETGSLQSDDGSINWVNPEGQQYPHNLLQPLLLIPDNRGRRVIPFAHFINNDLEYLRGGASSQKYTTSVTKTKAADYGHIKWIEDLVPRTMWIQEPINYDKHALWGVSHWGRKRQQFYGFTVNQEFALDVYSKRRIIAVIDLKIVEWHNYKHLDWISDVYKEYRHPAACKRSSTGSQKQPEEAQPYQTRHVPI